MSPFGESAWSLATELNRYPHIFVDARDGSRVVGHDDTVILKDGSSPSPKILAPMHSRGLPLGLEVDRASDATLDSANSVVRDLLLIILSPGTVSQSLPDRRGGRLEQLVSLIRHQPLETLPWTRLNRAADAIKIFRSTASPALLGLLAREGADAARALTRTAGPRSVRREDVRAFHIDAVRYFQAARMHSYVRETERLFREWDAPQLPPLPTFSSSSRPEDERISYRCVRVSAARAGLSLPLPTTFALPAELPSKRRVTGRWKMDEEVLLRMVARAECPTLSAWHRWETLADGHFQLEIGIDTSFFIQLGLAGRTGLKDNVFLVNLWGNGCEPKPSKTNIQVGQAARIGVTAPTGRRSAVDLQFTDRSHNNLRLRLEVPFDDASPIQGRATSEQAE